MSSQGPRAAARWTKRTRRPGLPHQLKVAGGPVPVQDGLVLGRRTQIQGLGVGRQGALVVPAFEQLVAIFPQLLHGAGLRRGAVQTSALGSGSARSWGSGTSPPWRGEEAAGSGQSRCEAVQARGMGTHSPRPRDGGRVGVPGPLTVIAEDLPGARRRGLWGGRSSDSGIRRGCPAP